MSAVGDRVAYTARFLQSIQADKDVADRRGTVQEIVKLGSSTVARIRWDDEPDELSSALVSNVARVGSVAFSDPHARKPS